MIDGLCLEKYTIEKASYGVKDRVLKLINHVNTVTTVSIITVLYNYNANLSSYYYRI